MNWCGDRYEYAARIAESVSAIYERNRREFMERRRVLIYGSYLDVAKGIRFLEELRDRLRANGFRHAYLVKDLSDEDLGVPRAYTAITDSALRSLLRSLYSFRIADLLVFVLSYEPLRRYVSGVIVELVMYADLYLRGGDVPEPLYALVLIDEELLKARGVLSSLVWGVLRILQDLRIGYVEFSSIDDAVEAVQNRIDYVIREEKRMGRL